MTDDLLFSENDESDREYIKEPVKDNWKILIVDDEPEVHQITKLTLVNFQFENKGLEFIHAYSSVEALDKLSIHSDIALILLDVVMETDHAGLELIHKVRQELKNESIRIVLRTGQPGEAPERDIILNYDINDYTEKAELSAQKLFTIVVASLRSYRDILKLIESRKELLHANQQLADERERMQVTLDSIGDAVMTTDAAGNVTHLNPVAEQLTGWCVSEAAGRDVKDVFPIVDASTGQPIENPVDKVIASGETVYLSNHTTLIAKTGKQYQIADSAAPIRDESQRIFGMVLVFRDVTEQYQLREAAAKSRRNLQMIMDYTPAVIYAKDKNGRYIFINQKFEKLFKISNKDIIGKTDHDIFPAEFADKFRANDLEVLASGKTRELEEEVPHRDRVQHYLSVKFPLFDEDGIYASCGISTDITERKKQEMQLRRAQKMEAIGQLTGGIAHDFNNQLGVVIGYLDMLKESARLDDSARKWIDTASRAAMRCTDLTRQLLSFSRTHSEEIEVVNINKQFQDFETMLSRTVTPAIEIQYFLADSLWLTEINTGEFQDAVLNMVINARDAMPDGGKLLIETSNKYLDGEYVTLCPDVKAGYFVQLMLSDTGKGMDKLTQEKIFDPFYTTKEKGKGTGLGMSMVYGFVKRSGGFIKVYSEENIGTTIRLFFPAASEVEAEDKENIDTETSFPRGDEIVLIVDDEVDLLHLAESYLISLGYKVYLAKNAAQALNILENHNDIDLLFSDVVMPGGMNGYELAERATQRLPDLQVLLTSGFTSNTIAQNGQLRFAAQLLTKPYRKIDLAKRIRKVME